jgi:hypothetical protein
MKKLILVLGLITLLAIAPNAFAGGYCFNCNQTADANAQVFDMETGSNGFVIGGARASADAYGPYEANAFAGAGSAMSSDTDHDIGFSGIGIWFSESVENHGSVGAEAAADAGGRWSFKDHSRASVEGGVLQGGAVEIGLFGTEASAWNVSGAAFSDYEHDDLFDASSSASGQANTGGFAYVERGSSWTGKTQWSAAETGNYANATGYHPVAGGMGGVATQALNTGAATNGSASFCYTGNGAGNAASYSEATSYKSGGTSYKSAFTQSSASVNGD